MSHLSKIIFILLILSAEPVAAQSITQICDRHGAGPGSIDAVTINHSGVNRYYCVYKPSSYPMGNTHRVVFVFHGGGGNASVLMAPAKGLINGAESNNYVAVFAQGASRDDCGRKLSKKNNWTDQDCAASDNIGYSREMIKQVMLDYNVQRSHIQLAGFSGGAKHIYRMIADWTEFDPVIRSFATMAGSMHKTTFKDDIIEYETVNILNGVPTNALLIQGGDDIRMPQLGGLSSRKQELLGSFKYKVDNFVVLNSSRTPTGGYDLDQAQALNVNTTPSAYPLGAAGAAGARLYPAGPSPQGDAETVSILAPGTPHSWRAWMSAEAFRFYSRF